MKRNVMEIIVGIFIVIGIVFIGYMTTVFGKVQLFGKDTYRINARFTSVSGLRGGSPIEVFGINVGTVEGLKIDEERGMAVVEMGVKNGLEIYDDGSASIRTAGLIGDRYVKIDPGGSGELIKPGGWITQTSSPIDIEELIGKYAFGSIGKPGSDGGKPQPGEGEGKKPDLPSLDLK